jgi:succinylarginine dihydrolase
MNADRLKYKEITDSILRSFYEVYNELGDGSYMIIKEKISVMISVDRRLSSYIFSSQKISEQQGIMVWFNPAIPYHLP